MEKEPLEEVRLDPIPGEYGNPMPLELFYRELGMNGPLRHKVGRVAASSTLSTKAVHTLCTKPDLKRRCFKLPTGARTTFHMAFSSDGSRVASCHGDHNVYVCDVATGGIIKTLTGHPRTPWCVVFHPTQNDILASGCLAGHIRVWDLKGGSEVLVTDSGTVIASLAFHPTVRLLAIATFNEIIFWDWGLSHPLARCSTQNTKEKVRLVRFDRLGHSLITGITNFPTPPVRAGVTKGVSGGQSGPPFRPNILSRRSWQSQVGVGSSSLRPGSGSFYAYPRRTPAPENTTVSPSDNTMQSVADSTVSLQRDSETQSLVDGRANVQDRQERFQESYRQLVHHYQDLVSNYQQFLRSRIPRLLETSRGMREEDAEVAEVFIPQIVLNSNDFDQSPESSSDNSLDGTASVTLNISPNPVIVPELVSEPESGGGVIAQLNEPMVIDNEIPGPSRLSQLEARLIEHMEADVDSSEVTPLSNSIELSVPVSTAANDEATPGPSRENGLRNIEALAQNIMEMQHLCSQARRDAPLAVENQHIMELQNIRRHLELLQDQTRDLQSSIRATLTSLARGTFDISRAIEEAPDNSPLTAEAVSLVESAQNVASMASMEPLSAARILENGHAVGEALAREAESYYLGDSSPNVTLGTGRVTPPDQLLITNSSAPARSRVPPALAMHYDISPDGFYTSRNTSNTNNSQEPIPGPSRQMFPQHREEGDGNSNGRGRLVREYHVVHGSRVPGEPEHSRNCPFSVRDGLSRPPTRMRCLTEMGENPTLTVWPSPEMEQIVPRSLGVANERNLSPTQSQRSTDRSIQGSSSEFNPFSTYPLPVFSQWMNNGPYWVNNAIGVGVFLAVRQANDTSSNSTGMIQLNETLENISNEEWQNSFIAGLGLVPPNVREGQRQQYRRIRRGQNIIYHMSQGQGRLFTLRPSQWDEFRSNFLSPNSPTDIGNLPWNSPYLQERPVELPDRLDGNFTRSFSMRSGDEVTPVYATTNGSLDTFTSLTPGDIRDSPIANVYAFPLGLFIEGNSFTGGPQTLGIYWPPASREEEDALREFRRSEALIPVVSIEDYDSISGFDWYQIDYDETQLRITIDGNSSLLFIHPGLLLLDAVTTMSNWPRPRAISGTVFVNHLSPLLDSWERLFGHRMRRSAATFSSPTSSISPVPSTSGPSLRMSTVMQPTLLGARTSSGRSINWVPVRPFTTSSSPRDLTPGQVSTLNPEFYSRTLIRRLEERERARSNNPRRLIDFANPEPSAQQQRSVGARNPNENLEAYRRRFVRDYLGQEVIEGGLSGNGEPLPPSLAHFISVSHRRRSRHPIDSGPSGSGRQEGRISSTGPSSSTRRFIQLAVDTATAEVLRRHPNTSSRDAITLNQTVQRAIESRIERVLNERGNRGVSNQYGPSSDASVATTSNATDREREQGNRGDLEMRRDNEVSSLPLPLWASRAMSSSSTQTTQPFVGNSTPGNTNSIGVGTSPMSNESLLDDLRSRSGSGSRRRSYSRLANTDGSDRSESNNLPEEESAPPLPPRIARLNNDSGFGDARIISNIRSSDEVHQNTASTRTLENDNSNQLPLLPPQIIAVTSSGALTRRHRSSPFMTVPRIIIPRVLPGQSQNSTRSESTRSNNSTASDSPVSEEANSRGNDSRPTNNATTNGTPIAGTSSNSSSRRLHYHAEQISSRHYMYSLPRRSPYPPTNANDDPNNNSDPTSRSYPGYNPEILITPRVRPPNYYAMDAATTAFLSSRIQKWDFSDFCIPDITKRNESIVVGECSLHSDACLDVSNDSEFVAVLQPSDNGSYSAVGIYSLRDESLGDILYIHHFDQNTVSISIAPSSDYIVVGYAGRGPFYRFVNPSRSIGQILSLTRNERNVKLVVVKELYAETQNSILSVNCMHFVPVPGYGIIYGTNTGELILLC